MDHGIAIPRSALGRCSCEDDRSAWQERIVGLCLPRVAGC